MSSTYKAGDARQQLHKILSELEASRDPITIERNEKPVAVLLDYDRYEKIMNAISLLSLASKLIPSEDEQGTKKSKVATLYGSLRPKEKVRDIEKAIHEAREDHIIRKFKKS